MQDSIESYLRSILNTSGFRSFYDQLRKKYKTLLPYPECSGLLSLLHNQSIHDHGLKNRLLCILIIEYQQHPSELLASFLLVIFSPAINSIVSENRKYFPGDLEGLCSEIRSILLEVVRRYDCEVGSDWIAKKVVRQTRDEVVKLMEKQLYGKIDFIGDELPETIVDCAIPGLDLSFIELFRKKGIISKQAASIILATRINERPVMEWAEQNSISYDAARKQRQRAENAIKKFMQRQRTLCAKSKSIPVRNVSYQEVMRWIFEQKL